MRLYQIDGKCLTIIKGMKVLMYVNDIMIVDPTNSNFAQMLMQFMFNLNTLSMVDVNGITHTLSGVAIPDGTLSLSYAVGSGYGTVTPSDYNLISYITAFPVSIISTIYTSTAISVILSTQVFITFGIIISEVGLLVNINIPANPPLTNGFSGTFLLTHDLVTPGVSISPLGGTLNISTVVVFS